MSVLTKMGIKMKKEDGEALKKSVEEVRQFLLDLGVPPPTGDGTCAPAGKK